MSILNTMINAIPVAPLKICPLPGCEAQAAEVIACIENLQERLFKMKPEDIHYNYSLDSFLVNCKCPRFGSGEAKGYVEDSVRGVDLYLISDVCNHSVTYRMRGITNYLSPDDHYQNLKRIISVCAGTAHRIILIMPFLYEGRQHKRSGRESLDSALALQELYDMGVSNIVTFDAHDPKIVNSIPLCGFENFYPTYQFLQALFKKFPDIPIDAEHLMVISPDEGAMSRAKYFSNVLGVDMGMFYKRRDYSVIVNGKNPIVAHEFLGSSLEGKDTIIVDDMIASGESMLHVAKEIKERGARRVHICATYGLFTEGLEAFDEFYKNGFFDSLITTDLTYQTPELLQREWYISAALSNYMGNIIYAMNHDVSLSPIINNTTKINKLVETFNQEM